MPTIRSTQQPLVVLATCHRVDDQRIAHRQARSLAEADFNVHLVGKQGPTTSELPFAVTEVKGSIEGIRSRLQLARHVLNEALRLDPELLLLHDLDLLLLAARRLPAMATVFDSHENYDLNLTQRLPAIREVRPLAAVAARCFANLEGVLIRRVVSGVSVVVPRQVDYYQQLLQRGVRKGKGAPVALVPNYPTERIFTRPACRTDDRDRHFDVIHAGSLSPDRGLALLPAIVSELERRGGNRLRFGVVLRTYRSTHDTLIDAVRREVGDRVEWLPSVPHGEMPELLRATKVLLSPLLPSGQNPYVYPTKLFESWSQGTPAVVGDVGYSAALTRESRCGVVVSPNDPIAYADAIIELLGDTRRRREMGESGVHYVFEKGHSWESGAFPGLRGLCRDLMFGEPLSDKGLG